MEYYHQPFECAFHARLKISNIRLRSGSIFERSGTALLAQSKFATKSILGAEYGEDVLEVAANDSIIESGFRDRFSPDAVFAFGKLYSASEVVVHVNELELWSMSRVYEWDELHVIGGEATAQFVMPPDYVTAQSNVLYKQKELAKFICSHYVEGEPYPFNLDGIPEGIAESLRDGTCERGFFESWYTSTVKGMFNGIYGTMAQDQYKPKFVCIDGEIFVNPDTICRLDNFEEKKPKSSMVLYTYGMRIVGGSRMHMIIAMELIHEAFGSKVDILGGDTDSMKLRCDYDITDEAIEKALRPIADCSKAAIDCAMQRLRRCCPEFSSPLTGIGGFEIENKGEHYLWHVELWNKCRVSVDEKNRSHITCAGLSRPYNRLNIEGFMDALIQRYGADKVLPNVIGFNTYVSNAVAHALEAHHPKATDVFEKEVTDYLGNKSLVRAHESTSLYPVGRWLGETSKVGNLFSLNYIERNHGRKIDSRNKYLEVDGMDVVIRTDSALGIKDLMRAGYNA